MQEQEWVAIAIGNLNEFMYVAIRTCSRAEVIMLIYLCIILFRSGFPAISLHHAPNSMHYSQNCFQDHCQNNLIALLQCMSTLLE